MDKTILAGFGNEPTSYCGEQWEDEPEHQEINAGANQTSTLDRLEVKGIEVGGPDGEERVVEGDEESCARCAVPKECRGHDRMNAEWRARVNAQSNQKSETDGKEGHHLRIRP